MSKDIEAALAAVKGVERHGEALRITFHYQRKRCREVIPLPLTKTNIKHASRLREAILHEIAIGTFDYAKHFPDSPRAARFAAGHGTRTLDITLGDLVARYLQVKEVDVGDNAKGRYKSILTMLAGDLDPRKMVSALRPEDMQRWRRYLITEPRSKTGRPLAPRSVNYYLMVAAGLLEFAQANRYTTLDLASALNKVGVVRDKPEPFDQDEEARLLAATRHPMDAAWIKLAIWTGLRTGELCALAWEDIDMTRGELTVRRNITQVRTFKPPKTGKERTLVLLPPALEALRELRAITAVRPAYRISRALRDGRLINETCTFVITPGVTTRTRNSEMCYTAFTLGDKWDRLVRRAGIRRRTQYHMRHTFASRMLTAGANPEWVGAYLGHEDSHMVRTVYGTWIPEHDRDEVDRVWGRIGAEFFESAPKMPQEIKKI
ncbi:MAG: Arm DNA-binding domain-containing protein [Aeromonas sp.]